MYTNDTVDINWLYYKCPVLYTSSIVKGIKNKYGPPSPAIEIDVNDKVIINKNLVQFAKLNKSYLFNLMAKDPNGKIYRITNNTISGFSFGVTQDDIKSNIFKIYCGGWNISFEVYCDFE